MSRALETIADALDQALEEVAAAEDLALIPEQAAQHWRNAMAHFLRAVEVASNERQRALWRAAEQGRRGR